jgi:hypothetical protein
MKRYLLLIAALASAPLWAQTSAYQSADGDTSILLYNSPANLVFNISDTKFDVGYLHQGGGKGWQYGADITGKPSSDLGPQLTQRGSSPSAIGGSFTFGRHSPFTDIATIDPTRLGLRDDWLVLQGSYSRSTFNTVADGTVTVHSQRFDGVKAMAIYNALVRGPGMALLIGGAAGVSRTNNLGDMTSVTVATTLAQSSGVSILQEDTAYYGTYKTSIGAPIYSDFVAVPNGLKWLDIDAFFRANPAKVNRYFEGGVGAFVADHSNVSKVLGGVSMGWKNGDPTISLVAGWSF